MSERMIELQRAKLGLPPAGITPSNPSQSTTGKNISAMNNGSSAKRPSPAEVANTTLLSEDAQTERFINRLQRRDRKTTTTHHHSNLMPASSGPTVPNALSRRMLQRQGVGYLDETVASVVSASADRFLATVLQQSIACRDQRLKGAVMSREAAEQRKRHMEEYEADKLERKRRRDSIIKAREDIAKFTIEAAESIKKGGSTGSGKAATSTATKKRTTKKKKAKDGADASSANNTPAKLDPAMEALAMEESEEEYDSIDEEEEYYQENVVEVKRERISLKKTGGNEDDDDDEDEDEDSDDEDDTLLLRDIVRPLEAWNFHLIGKEAIQTDDDYDEFENNRDIQDGGNSKVDDGQSTPQKESQGEEKGRSENNDVNAIANGTEESKQQSNEKKQGDAPANGNKNGASKKSTTPASSSTNNLPSST